MNGSVYEEDDLYVKIYNPAEKKLIASYESYKEASQKIGISAKVIRSAAITKTRRFSPILNMEIAVRLAKK